VMQRSDLLSNSISTGWYWQWRTWQGTWARRWWGPSWSRCQATGQLRSGWQWFIDELSRWCWSGRLRIRHGLMSLFDLYLLRVPLFCA
jgi:hypothetical protein